MRSGKNYLEMSRTFQAVAASNSYLDKVAVASRLASSGGSVSSSPVSSSGPVSTGLNCLGGLGGGSAMKAGKNYLGMSRSFRPTASNSYLDKVADASPVASRYAASSSSSPSVPVSSGLNYLGGLGGGSAMKSGTNYLGMSRTFRPTASNSYLDKVTQAAPVVSSYSSSAGPTSSGPVSSGLNYLGGLRGGSAMKSGKNYSGVNNRFGPTKSGNTYLDNVRSVVPPPAPVYASAVTSTPAVAAVNSVNYMGSLGGGSVMKSGNNYSGVNQKFGLTRSSNSYLDEVKGTVL
jgi:hypothetical protein